jgi:hypothetical protein
VNDMSSTNFESFNFMNSKTVANTDFFNTFVIMMILSNCVISILMIGIVLHGSFLYDLTKIPVMLLVSYGIYFATKYLMAAFLTLQ